MKPYLPNPTTNEKFNTGNRNSPLLNFKILQKSSRPKNPKYPKSTLFQKTQISPE